MYVFITKLCAIYIITLMILWNSPICWNYDIKETLRLPVNHNYGIGHLKHLYPFMISFTQLCGLSIFYWRAFDNCRRESHDVTERAKTSTKACKGLEKEISLV